MPEIRCPMCSKLNPEELEVCQFCQARLKPLRLSPAQGEESDQMSEVKKPQLPGEFEKQAPEWLQSLREPSEGSLASSKPKEAASDWLDGFRDESVKNMEKEESWPVEEPPPAEEPRADESHPEPDWLSRLAPQGPKTGTSGITDWLSGLDQRPPEPGLTESQKEISEKIEQAELASAEQLPKDVELETSQTLSSASEELPSLPDWLTDEESKAPDWMHFDTSPVDEEKQVEEGSSEESPDWLASFMGEGSQAEPADEKVLGEDILPEEASPPEPTPTGELDWLKELEEAYPGSNLDEGTSPEYSDRTTIPSQGIGEEEVRSAYQKISPERKVEQDREEFKAEVPAEPSGANEEPILPGSLPGWLEAMRPVVTDVVGPEQLDDQHAPVEKAGPLAGLRDTLPAELDIYHTKKPITFSTKLRIFDNQQAHAKLLEEMISQEGSSPAIPSKAIITRQHLIRSVIFLVLVIVAALPLFWGYPVVAIPVYASEVIEAHQMIESLPAGSPVLVAIDFQPGYSGEMGALAGALLDHLMFKKIHLGLVSTHPDGPIFAEKIVGDTIQIGFHNFQYPRDYVNLGFIPGGTAGLLNFAVAPRQVLPFDVNGQPVWQAPPFDSIQTLSNFAMLVVMTEDAETARLWIEQVQPRLLDTPLVLALSAQAEPIVKPYYLSSPKQVNGLVVGLTSGVTYEAYQGRAGLATEYWSSFTLSLISSIVIIVMGIGQSMISLLLSQRKSRAKGDRSG